MGESTTACLDRGRHTELSALFHLVNRRSGSRNFIVLTDDRELLFVPEDVDLLSRRQEQIAIAIENAMAYQEFLNSRTSSHTGKLYLEEEGNRSDSGFERIIGEKRSAKEYSGIGGHRRSERSPVMLLGETGKARVAHCARNHEPRGRRKDVPL